MRRAEWSPGRAATYYRASTEWQEERETIRTQRRAVQKFLAERGVEVVAEYVDDGVTGTISMRERPQGARCLDDARRGRYDTLYVYAVDRLGREAVWVLEAEHFLRKSAVKLQSATQPFDPHDVTGAFLLTLLAGQAQMNRAQTLTLLRAGTDRCAEEGYWLGGRVPFGYQLEWIGKRQRLALCDDPIPGCERWTPAGVIRYCFRRCVEDHATCLAIAEELNAYRVPTYWIPNRRSVRQPVYNRWTAPRVRRILICRTYAGTHTFGQSHGPSAQAMRDPTERPCPALVTVADLEAARVILRANQTFSSRSHRLTYLLSGLLHCAHCGRRFIGKPRPPGRTVRQEEGRGDWRVYACAGRDHHTPERPFCRASHWLPAAALEEHVIASLQAALADPEGILDELRIYLGDEEQRTDDCRQQITALQDERAALERQDAEYIRLRAAGLIRSDAQLKKLQGELDGQDTVLARRIEEIGEQITAAREQDAILHRTADLIEEIAAGARSVTTPEDWKKLLPLYVARIVIHARGEGRQKRAWAQLVTRFGVAQAGAQAGGNVDVDNSALVRWFNNVYSGPLAAAA